MLHLDGLDAGYAGSRGAVLRGVTASVARGTFICVLGRNGIGKSTLMRTIAGLQGALAARVLLEGRPVVGLSAAERARKIAVVLTERGFSPGLTVEDVVALGRQPFTGWLGGLGREDRACIARAMSAVNLGALVHRLLDTLSDGERQRAMIARAIAQDPLMMVLDEVTAYLDLPGRVEVMSLLRHHAHDSGVVILLSSHDLDLSLQLADQVWILDQGGIDMGAPAQVIARGAVGRAFDTEAVAFSRDLGRFTLRA